MVDQERARSGAVLFTLKQGEQLFYLASRYDPEKEAARVVSVSESTADCSVFILFGAGNPYLIREIIKQGKQQPLIIIAAHEELNQRVIDFISRKWPDLFSVRDVYFYNRDNYEKELEKLVLKYSFRRMRIFHNRNEYRIDPFFFDQARSRIITLQNRKSINTATISRFEKLWLRNVIKNSELIMEAVPLRALKGLGRDQRAVIVGAGPTLAAEIILLKKHQCFLVIVAVDTVYKTLLKHGIIPDMVVVVDPQKINSRYLENIPADACAQSFFISEPAVCTKGIADKLPGLAMFDTIFPYYDLLTSFFGRKGELDMGGSVATTAYEVCRYLEFKETALLGMDLAFSKDAYHLPGTMYEQEWFSSCSRLKTYDTMTFKLIDYNNLEKTVDNQGQPVYMDAKFVMFKNWFEKKRQMFPEYPVCNCSDGGVEIKGIPFKPFKDFVKKNSGKVRTDFQLALQQTAARAMKKKGAVCSKLPGFLTSLTEIINNISGYELKCKEAAAAAAKASARQAMGQSPQKAFQRLQTLDQQLAADFSGKALINIAVQKIIHKINDGYELEFDYEITPEQRVSETSAYLYREMAKACSLNRRYLSRVITELKKKYQFD